MARALDVLGERWSLLILRDLLAGATRFNDLARGLPGLSRTLLSQRLRQFERGGLLERADGRYVLTRAGRAAEPIVSALADWGAEFAFGDPEPEERDVRLLVWWIHQGLDPSAFPEGCGVIHFRFTDDRHEYWIRLDAGEATMRTYDAGPEVDVTVTSDVSSLLQVWLGRLPLQEAVRSGRVELGGPAALARRMPALLRLSPEAPAVRAHS
jgi:DNA-binding HxlR family transcriptional regulator